MIYNHFWTPPHIAVVVQEGGPVHVPVQLCARCMTTKNPLTDQIVSKRGRGECAHQDPPPAQDHSARLRRLKAELDAIEGDGQKVDRDYGRKAREPIGLPLPYKD